MVLGIFKISLRFSNGIGMFLCDKSLEILTVFNTLTLEQIFWITKIFFKKLEQHFLFETLRLKAHHFHTKLPYQQPMLRQIEWGVQNRPITKNGVLPVTTLFFWKFSFSLRTAYKELTWCTNLNVNIRTFRKHWKFIFRMSFPCEYP